MLEITRTYGDSCFMELHSYSYAAAEEKHGANAVHIAHIPARISIYVRSVAVKVTNFDDISSISSKVTKYMQFLILVLGQMWADYKTFFQMEKPAVLD